MDIKGDYIYIYNHDLIRMHLVGDPSAPANLKGKQWIEYIPAGT